MSDSCSITLLNEPVPLRICNQKGVALMEEGQKGLLQSLDSVLCRCQIAQKVRNGNL